MSMTAKHFNELARIMANSRYSCRFEAQHELWREIYARLEAFCMSQSSRFDRRLFRQACETEEGMMLPVQPDTPPSQYLWEDAGAHQAPPPPQQEGAPPHIWARRLEAMAAAQIIAVSDVLDAAGFEPQEVVGTCEICFARTVNGICRDDPTHRSHIDALVDSLPEDEIEDSGIETIDYIDHREIDGSN